MRRSDLRVQTEIASVINHASRYDKLPEDIHQRVGKLSAADRSRRKKPGKAVLVMKERKRTNKVGLIGTGMVSVSFARLVDDSGDQALYRHVAILDWTK